MRNTIATAVRFVVSALLAFIWSAASAGNPAGDLSGPQNSIENIQVSQQAGNILVRVTLRQALPALPGSFSIANPARLAFDFPATGNGLGRTVQQVNEAT